VVPERRFRDLVPLRDMPCPVTRPCGRGSLWRNRRFSLHHPSAQLTRTRSASTVPHPRGAVSSLPGWWMVRRGRGPLSSRHREARLVCGTGRRRSTQPPPPPRRRAPQLLAPRVPDPTRPHLAPQAGLRTVTGDARSTDDIARAAADVDVLVGTIGVGTSRKSHNLLQDTMRAVIEAAQQTGLKRVVVQSAFGTGASYEKAPLLMRLGYHYGRDVFVDKEEAEQALFDSDLDWTLVYPVVLSHKPGTGHSIATDLGALGRLRGLPQVPRDDGAAFLLSAVADNAWTRRIAAQPGCRRRRRATSSQGLCNGG